MTLFEKDIQVYDIISILGECFQSQAIVNLAKHSPSGQMLAVKRFRLEKISDNINLIEQEVTLTRQLNHPNILQYYTSFVHGPEVIVISPLQGFGSCKSLLNSHFNEGLPELAIILILRDVLEAVNYLHKNGWIHRAIRASHILISTKGQAILTGLRYACSVINHGKWQRAIHSFPLTTQPNLNWLSPELLEQNLRGYNEKSDIYSLGIVCCEMANGHEPFFDVDSTLMLVEKVKGWVPGLIDSCTVNPADADDRECQGDCEIPSSLAKRKFNQCLHDFCYVCLERDSENRPTSAQLLSHPLFKLIKKGMSLPELLKPVLPLSDRVAFNKEEIVNVNPSRDDFEADMSNYDWDFSTDTPQL